MILAFAQSLVKTGFVIAVQGLGRFLYDWQTLISGLIALVAAFVAVRPVWKQLALTQTQANGVLREMLLKREVEIGKAHVALVEKVRPPLNELDSELYSPDDQLLEFSAEGAHHYSQRISSAAHWLSTASKERDSAAVEVAKDALAEKLAAVEALLNEIHFPVSMDQEGEGYSISDEDWAKYVARSEAAQTEVVGAVSAARSALREVEGALSKERRVIKARLKKVDEALLG